MSFSTFLNALFGNNAQGANPATFGQNTGVPTDPNAVAPTTPTAADNSMWSTLGLMGQGVGEFGKIFGALQANNIARDTLEFQKDAFKKNLAAQRQTYNTALSDRATARYSQMGRPEDAADYISRNRM